MVRGTWISSGMFGTPAGPAHYLWDVSLGPYGAPTPKLKRYLKQKGNRQLRRQHKRQIEQALREHALDLHLDHIEDLHDAWSDFGGDFWDDDPESDLQAQEDAENAIWDDYDRWHTPEDARHDLVQHHHIGLSIQELVRIKGLQLRY